MSTVSTNSCDNGICTISFGGKQYTGGVEASTKEDVPVTSQLSVFNTTCYVMFGLTIALVFVSCVWVYALLDSATHIRNIMIGVIFVACCIIGLGAGGTFWAQEKDKPNKSVTFNRTCLFIPAFVLAIVVFLTSLIAHKNIDGRAEITIHNITLSCAVSVMTIGIVLSIYAGM